jgi:alkanesulfonate monooxygenase SsuD/methylene tetrahydromethanopterin reductase-like flavin-dependent oxidoreductase (luciferase family)
MAPRPELGLVLGNEIAPEQLVELARLGEEHGFDELWLPEDYFYNGGIAAAATVLAATERVRIGLGIVSCMARHPAVLAIECSVLARIHPGRLTVGVGMGQPAWVKQMGIYPKSQLAALEECVTALRELLAGAVVDREGQSFSFDNVQLTHPATTAVPIYVGVIGPNLLRLAGGIADGIIASIFASAQYLTWMRAQVAGGADPGRSERHPLACFALFSVDEDGDAALAALRPTMAFYLSVLADSPLIDVYGIGDELRALNAAGGPDRIAAEMPDAWLRDLAVVGTPAECAAQIERLHAAGADSIALFPTPADRSAEMVRIAGTELLPLLR